LSGLSESYNDTVPHISLACGRRRRKALALLASLLDAMTDLRALLGQTDIYLVDQVLRGRIAPGMRIFDAGCGSGRNLVFFLREGYDVAGVDADPGAIAAVRQLAHELAPRLPAESFRQEAIESHSFPRPCAEVVLSSAVLHFARDPAHFRALLDATWAALAPGGLFFCRLASTIGMPDRFRPLGNGRFALPDGSERYLVDEPTLDALTAELGAELLDPLKTTVVHNQRSMTTWVLRK
jgi:tellurite methyltransferase